RRGELNLFFPRERRPQIAGKLNDLPTNGRRYPHILDEELISSLAPHLLRVNNAALCDIFLRVIVPSRRSSGPKVLNRCVKGRNFLLCVGKIPHSVPARILKLPLRLLNGSLRERHILFDETCKICHAISPTP